MIEIRKIQPEDNHFVKELVLDTLKEFGACGPGFASSDEELKDMYTHYQEPMCEFYIAISHGKPVGAAGFGALPGEEKNKIAELRKMYLLKENRGQGIGRKLLENCLKDARALGYRSMYLETMESMKSAQELYQSFGFKFLDKRLGDTGHSSCPVFMMTKL